MTHLAQAIILVFALAATVGLLWAATARWANLPGPDDGESKYGRLDEQEMATLRKTHGW